MNLDRQLTNVTRLPRLLQMLCKINKTDQEHLSEPGLGGYVRFWLGIEKMFEVFSKIKL
jgi:hypothetical protein